MKAVGINPQQEVVRPEESDDLPLSGKTLVVTALLPSRGRGFLYDPEVSDGKILVGIEHPSSDAVPTVEQALRAAAPDTSVKIL